MVDPLNHKTVTSYDANSNVVKVTDPLNAVTTAAYDALDRTTSITDPSTATTGFGYDALGNRLHVTTPLGNITRWTYNADQQQETMIDPRGNVAGGSPASYTTRWSYDAAGHPISQTSPLGHGTATEFDSVGNATARVDANNNRTSYSYDELNRLVQVTAADQAVTRYGYDSVGNLTSRTDANGHATSYGYDDDRRLAEQIDPLGRRSRFSYDADGNATKRETPIGTSTVEAGDGTVSAVHDPLGRLTTLDYSDATPDVDYTYDLLGRVTSMADGAGRGGAAETYTYDPRHRLTGVSRSGSTFSYQYDADGRRIKRVYPDGTVVNNAYDSDDRLTSLTSGGATTTLAYDPAARLASTTFPASVGHAETRNYDRDGRLTEVSTAAGTTVLSQHVQSLDAAGNPVARANTRGTTTVSETLQYDQANRLTRRCAATSCSEAGIDSLTYTYDGVGNRKSEVRTGLAPATSSYTYDGADQLAAVDTGGATTAHQYDPNGRKTSAGPRRFAWGLDNRLGSTSSGSTTTSYTYDGAGRRLTQSTNGAVDNRFTWDIGDALPMLAAETDGAGVVQRRYLHRPGSAIGVTSSSSTSLYAHDLIGSVTDVVSSLGAAQWSYDYDPFGAARTTTKLDAAAAPNPLQYAGEYLDAASGRYHLRARQYDPSSGRFLATDPLAPQLDDPYVSSYVYVGNQPTRFIDPTGNVGWDTLYGVSNTAAGLGDTVSFGGTAWARRQLGSDDVVDRTSGLYGAGSAAGLAVGAATGGVGIAAGVARVGLAGTRAGAVKAVGNAGFEFGTTLAHQRVNGFCLDTRAALLNAGFGAAGAGIGLGKAYTGHGPLVAEGGASRWRGAVGSGDAGAVGRYANLGSLAKRADESLAEVIRSRGGGASQLRQLQTGYGEMKLGELSRMAAAGDREAIRAIKMAKQAGSQGKGGR